MDTGPVYGEPDGFGLYGAVHENDDGLLCHECGNRYTHLGLHAAKTHDLPARGYRVKHGLRRSKGLVAAHTRGTLRANAKNRYTDHGPLAATRDLSKANAARLGAARPASAEEVAGRDARMKQLGRNARRGTVVTCEQCGVLFCPLIHAAKRRFCARSCANRATRNATLARQRTGSKAEAPT